MGQTGLFSIADVRFPTNEEFLRDLKRYQKFYFERLEYAVRICLERWVSECEPEMIYRHMKFVGLGMKGGNGKIVVHAPPTDRFYTSSNTGYPPDWDFYNGRRAQPQAGSAEGE